MKKIIFTALLIFSVSAILFGSDIFVHNVFVCSSDDDVTVYIYADINHDGNYILWRARTMDNTSHTLKFGGMYVYEGCDNKVYAVQGNRTTPVKHFWGPYAADINIAFETAENCPPGQSNY